MNDTASLKFEQRINTPTRRKDVPGMSPAQYLAKLRAERNQTVTENPPSLTNSHIQDRL